MAYRGERCFPPAVGAEPANPGILVRGKRGFQAGCAHGFEHNRWRIGAV